MKKTLSIILSVLMIVSTFVFVPVVAQAKEYANRIETNFNHDWQFFRETYSGSSSTTIAQIEGKVGDDWRDVTLPHDFSIEGEFSTHATTNRSGCLQGGTGWYKKNFQIPADLSGKRFVINFDGVYSYSYVYVNGQSVGQNMLGYVSFALDITDYLNFGFDKHNEIVVKVVNNVPSERWYSGSGIYRDVTMIMTEPVHVDYKGTAVTFPNLAATSGVDGTTNVTAKVYNESSADANVSIVATVKDGNTTVATKESSAVVVKKGEKAELSASPVVTNPKLWDTKTPNLYTLVTDVLVDGEIVDTYSEQIGYRYTEYNNVSGFFLNGEPMKLKGAAMHNDFGAAIGTAAYDNSVKRYISLLKDMGCNAIRTAHQPLSQNLMDYCAQMGMMVYNEVYDEWLGVKFGDNGSYSFASGIANTNPLLLKDEMGTADVSGWSTATTTTWAEFGLKSIIRRDRNNPAVIIWGLGNELFEQSGVNSDASKQKHVEAAKNLAQWVHETDPQGRPCTFGDNRQETNSSGSPRKYLDQIQAEMDLTGINYAPGGTWDYLYGVFPERAAFNTEGTDQCSNRGEYDHTKLVNNGADDYEFTSYNNDDRGWANYLGEGWNLSIERDWFMGEFIWAGIDYLGEPCDYGANRTGLKTPNTTFCGAFDSAGFAKDSMYYWRSIWNEDSYTANMLPGTWNKNEVELDKNGFVNVMVYSNTDKVEVVLNGEVVGEATSTLVKTSSSDRTNYFRREWAVSVVDSTRCNNGKLVNDTSSNDFTHLFVQMKVKYEEGTLELKSYKLVDGEYVLVTDAAGTQFVETTEGITDIKVTQTETTLVADKNNIMYYAVDAVDKDGDFVNGYNGKVTFTLEGEGEIIGADNGSSINIDRGCSEYVVSADKKSATTSCYNGKCLLAVKATDEVGEFTVTATAYDETDATKVVATKGTTKVTTTADTVADEWEEEIEQHECVDFTSVVTNPTCEQDGFTTYTCTTCGVETKKDFVKANGHTTDANGTCTVCGKNAKVLDINAHADYVAQNPAKNIKYQMISLDDVVAGKRYSIAYQDGQNLYAFTNKMQSFWPNNYTVNYGFASYGDGKVLAKELYGDSISKYEVGEDLSHFYFDYDKEAGTVIISVDVNGERKYITFGGRDGNKISFGIKYTDKKEDSLVFTINKTASTGAVSLKTTYTDGANYYLCMKNCWYGKKVLLRNGADNSMRIFEAKENTDNAPLVKLGNAITKVNDAVNANFALADTVYENVARAIELYKQGVPTDECLTLSNTLVTSTHTCTYVKDLKKSGYSVMSSATCTKGGETYYYCTQAGCDNYKVVTSALASHSYGTDVTVINPATCITAGSGTVQCKNCSVVKEVVIDATGEHIYGDDGYCVADANCNACEFTVKIDGVSIAPNGSGVFVLPASVKQGFIAYTDGTQIYAEGHEFASLTANVELTSICVSLTMDSGASIRLNEVSGMRFTAQINMSELASFEALGGELVAQGILIAPTDSMQYSELNHSLATGTYVDVNGIPYGFYQGKEGKIAGSIVKIKETNIPREFMGRGYITVKLGDIQKTIYTDANNSSRSVKYIARRVFEDTAVMQNYSDAQKEQVLYWMNYMSDADEKDPSVEDNFD